MRKAKTLLFLGIWVTILPFLGFPQSYKTVLFVLSGLGVAYFGFNLYKESKKAEEGNFENFSENRDFNEM